MIRNRLLRAVRVLLMLSAFSLVITSSASADLLISMGNGAGLKWNWQPTQALKGALYTLVTSKEEAAAIAKQLPTHLQESTFADIDFTKQAALVAYLGEAPSGGYAIEMHNIQISAKQMWVNINRRSPAPDEVVTLMATFPIAVKRISLSDLPKQDFIVSFSDQTGRLLANKSVAVNGSQSTNPVTISLGKDSMLKWKWRSTKDLSGAVYALVTSEQEAKAIKAQLPASLRKDAFKGIDFKKQAAIVAHLGTAPNSGYAVDIHSAKIAGNKVQVKVSRRAPAQKELTLPVVSYPMVVKPVAKTKLPTKPVVEFIDQTGKKLPTTIASAILHTVKPGQTLWYIAWLYGVKMDDLMRWNGLTTKSVINTGQVLRIVK